MEDLDNKDDTALEQLDGPSRGAKRQKNQSKAWQDMTKFVVDGVERARCNHCKKEFLASSGNGTSHLLRHLKGCPGKSNHSMKNYILTARTNQDGNTILKTKSMIQKMCVKH